MCNRTRAVLLWSGMKWHLLRMNEFYLCSPIALASHRTLTGHLFMTAAVTRTGITWGWSGTVPRDLHFDLCKIRS